MIGVDPSPEYYRPAEFRVGSVLSRAIDVLFGNFVPFFLIGLLAVLPSVIYRLSDTLHHQAIYVWTNLILTFLLSGLCRAMIVFGTFQALRGRPVQPGESIAHGLQRLVPVLIASFLTSIVTTIGFILLIVPGLIAIVMLVVTLPACVVERLGPIESMSRSADLTAGYRWPIFGALVVVAIVSIVVTASIGATRQPDLLWLYTSLFLVWGAVSTSFDAVLSAIIYHDLRVVKEGIDLDHIAAIFD